MRSRNLQNGYVIEVRSREEAGSFDRFCGALRARKPSAVLKPGAVSVRYASLGNGTLAFAFPDRRTLNGKAVDLSATPLFDGPFLKAATGSERLEIRHGKSARILDFKKLSITER